MRRLPSHQLIAANGLQTNFEPESIAGVGLTTAQNVDGFDEFRSVGKVPGSTRVSDSHGAAVVSLHMFEYSDLTLTRQRKQVSLAADGVLRLINADKSLTSLTTGMAPEALCQVQMLDRMFLSGPSQLALATGGIQYDGTNVRNWGVAAPGLTETAVEALDNAADWTDTGAGATSSTDSAVSKDGTASVAVAKDGATTKLVVLDRSGLSHDLSAIGSDTLYVWLFLGEGMLQKLATSGSAVTILLGENTVDYDQHNFTVGELVPGWNLLSMVLASPDGRAGTGATLSDVNFIRLQLIANTFATTWTASEVRWDHMYKVDEGAPTTAEGAAGSPSGTYTYRVTYLTEHGLESNAGPASASRTVTNKKVELSAMPVSGDAAVIARYIYRDISADGIWRFVGQIDDNVTTTFTDNVADASLGSAQPPLAGDSVLDSSPPGMLLEAVIHENRVVGIAADDRFTLKVSEIAAPGAFRLIDELQLEEELVALENHSYGSLIYATDKVFLLTGDGVQSQFRVTEVTSQTGANGFRSVVKVKGLNMTLRESEMFLIANPVDPWFINGPVLDQFRALSNADLKDAHMIHDRSRFRVVTFGKAGATYDTIVSYQYATRALQQVSGEGSGTDPQDLRLGTWWTMSLPASIDPHCSAMVERTADLPELWVGGSDGYVYWLQDPAATDWAENTGTATVDAQIEYSAVPLGKSPGGRGRPRFIQINMDASAEESVWTISVELLSDPDSAIVQSAQTFTHTFVSGKSSPILSINTNARGQWCRIKLSNNVTADAGIVRGVKLYYIPRSSGFSGPRSA